MNVGRTPALRQCDSASPRRRAPVRPKLSLVSGTRAGSLRPVFPRRSRSNPHAVTARRFMQAAAAASLHGLLMRQALDDCEQMLSGAGARPDLARDEALRAWAEVTAAEATARFDLDASTPEIVFVQDRATGARTAIPVTDILRLLGPREVAAAPTPPAEAA